MTPIIMPNYFIFTGGPGAGKTAVLNERFFDYLN